MTDPNAILKLDKARREAFIGADVPALTTMFADDMVWIHGTARLDTKEGMLRNVASGRVKFLSIECTDESVRFLGDLAFFTAVATIRAESGDGIREVQNRYTVVWAPDGDNWKIVHHQATFIPETA